MERVATLTLPEGLTNIDRDYLEHILELKQLELNARAATNIDWERVVELVNLIENNTIVWKESEQYLQTKRKLFKHRRDAQLRWLYPKMH